MENNQLVAISHNRDITPSIWTMIREMAPVMHQARLFGMTSPDQAAAIMLKGHELGIGITASFELIQVVEGRPALSPRGAMAILHSSPEIKTIKVNRLVDTSGKFAGYECFMERSNGFSYTAKFTLDDAKRAGLIKPNSGWEKYPENMTMWRAIGFCADVVAPDITAGLTSLMKMPEQFNVAIDNSGKVIDLEIIPNVTPVMAAPVITLEQLLSQYGVDAVLAANNNKPPENDAELNAVALKLVGGL